MAAAFGKLGNIGKLVKFLVGPGKFLAVLAGFGALAKSAGFQFGEGAQKVINHAKRMAKYAGSALRGFLMGDVDAAKVKIGILRREFERLGGTVAQTARNFAKLSLTGLVGSRNYDRVIGGLGQIMEAAKEAGRGLQSFGFGFAEAFGLSGGAAGQLASNLGSIRDRLQTYSLP